MWNWNIEPGTLCIMLILCYYKINTSCPGYVSLKWCLSVPQKTKSVLGIGTCICCKIFKFNQLIWASIQANDGWGTWKYQENCENFLDWNPFFAVLENGYIATVFALCSILASNTLKLCIIQINQSIQFYLQPFPLHIYITCSKLSFLLRCFHKIFIVCWLVSMFILS